ncbi:MAG: rhomboid family intramembrane serine protease [Oscillospiraceae bacterium]|nr:rhomboid family intramembrane serine protease [Oscillospiraceae bacterium]
MKRKWKLQYNSPVVLSFTALSLLALLLNALTGGWSNRTLFSVYRASLLSPLTWLRLFTHVLGHSGYAHFIGNMLLFLVVGPPMEEKYGSRRLLIAILITAAVTGVVEMAFFPGRALLGASGVVFMLILLSSLSGMGSGAIPLTLILVAVLYLGQELVHMLSLRDNVSQLAHLLGGLCGAGIGFAFRKR